MRDQKMQAQMRKGTLELCILLLLQNEPAYSSDIVTELKEADMIIVEGTIYPLLSRLKNSGYLSYQWQESTQGPPRKYYQITDLGLQYLKDLIEAWEAVVNSVNSLIEKNSHPAHREGWQTA